MCWGYELLRSRPCDDTVTPPPRHPPPALYAQVRALHAQVRALHAQVRVFPVSACVPTVPTLQANIRAYHTCNVDIYNGTCKVPKVYIIMIKIHYKIFVLIFGYNILVMPSAKWHLNLTSEGKSFSSPPSTQKSKAA